MTRQNTAPLSVVIPVYNDASGIAQTLDSLTAQSTKGDYEIAVVDNNSTDQTPEVINSYDDDRITLYHETEIQSSYAARNTGIRNTASEILAFVDADMTVPEHWLENALDAFHSTDADYMGCNVDLTLPITHHCQPALTTIQAFPSTATLDTNSSRRPAVCLSAELSSRTLACSTIA